MKFFCRVFSTTRSLEKCGVTLPTAQHEHLPFSAERQAGKRWIPIFQVLIGMPDEKIECNGLLTARSCLANANLHIVDTVE